MADRSSIEWTRGDDGTPGATWNPVTGCDEVSPGCDHCYAKTFAERWRGIPGHHFENGFDLTLRPERLDQPLRWKKPRRIFVNSMSDLFHDGVPDEFIARVFAVMALAERHTFQVLTKRHGRMRSLLSSANFAHLVAEQGRAHHIGDQRGWLQVAAMMGGPLPNVWLGVSVEDQKWADIRIPALLDTPAAVRFLSCEPLLGPIDLRPFMRCNVCKTSHQFGPCDRSLAPVRGGPLAYFRPDWVIVGGESGHGARPMHPDWARQLRDQCTAAGVPFHFKQWGEWGPAPWSVRIPEPAEGWHGVDADWLAGQKRDAEARGATHHIMPSGHLYEPDHKPWSLERDPDGDYPGAVHRWGKKAAGRELDGRTWDEYPAVAP